MPRGGHRAAALVSLPLVPWVPTLASVSGSAPKANTPLYDKGRPIRSFADVTISTRPKGTDGLEGRKVASRGNVISLS
ncbi:hypothetical protein GCM10010503_04470 [Streptomyces lucensis JCM 4490]|uniref:Uncharacterized protein n=1 Tax=Streptomyces lucensis JCM 4490 TaxID=1306176 RepID=A0A918IU42_9ACTN|nr:hypothetical protein GCM10010503_04470 [Streptomyces lucensis JCM 4490]